jgi:hypothetical protein
MTHGALLRKNRRALRHRSASDREAHAIGTDIDIALRDLDSRCRTADAIVARRLALPLRPSTARDDSSCDQERPRAHHVAP